MKPHANEMPEVRRLLANERPPEDSDHVVIDRTRGGKFIANGSVAGEMSATFYSPAPFDTIEMAIASATDWAARNGVPVVYIREG